VHDRPVVVRPDVVAVADALIEVWLWPDSMFCQRIVTNVSRSSRLCSCQSPTAWPISCTACPNWQPAARLITCGAGLKIDGVWRPTSELQPLPGRVVASASRPALPQPLRPDGRPARDAGGGGVWPRPGSGGRSWRQRGPGCACLRWRISVVRASSRLRFMNARSANSIGVWMAIVSFDRFRRRPEGSVGHPGRVSGVRSRGRSVGARRGADRCGRARQCRSRAACGRGSSRRPRGAPSSRARSAGLRRALRVVAECRLATDAPQIRAAPRDRSFGND
jgi:hypothetical protein